MGWTVPLITVTWCTGCVVFALLSLWALVFKQLNYHIYSETTHCSCATFSASAFHVQYHIFNIVYTKCFVLLWVNCDAALEILWSESIEVNRSFTAVQFPVFWLKEEKIKPFFLLHVLPQVSQRSPTVMLTLVFPPLCILIIIRWLWILVLQTSKHRQLQYSYQWKIFFISFLQKEILQQPLLPTHQWEEPYRTSSMSQTGRVVGNISC